MFYKHLVHFSLCPLIEDSYLSKPFPVWDLFIIENTIAFFQSPIRYIFLVVSPIRFTARLMEYILFIRKQAILLDPPLIKDGVFPIFEKHSFTTSPGNWGLGAKGLIFSGLD